MKYYVRLAKGTKYSSGWELDSPKIYTEDEKKSLTAFEEVHFGSSDGNEMYRIKLDENTSVYHKYVEIEIQDLLNTEYAFGYEECHKYNYSNIECIEEIALTNTEEEIHDDVCKESIQEDIELDTKFICLSSDDKIVWHCHDNVIYNKEFLDEKAILLYENGSSEVITFTPGTDEYRKYVSLTQEHLGMIFESIMRYYQNLEEPVKEIVEESNDIEVLFTKLVSEELDGPWYIKDKTLITKTELEGIEIDEQGISETYPIDEEVIKYVALTHENFNVIYDAIYLKGLDTGYDEGIQDTCH